METPVGRDGGGGLQGEEAKEGRRAKRLREDPHSGDEEDGVGMMTARAGDRK